MLRIEPVEDDDERLKAIVERWLSDSPEEIRAALENVADLDLARDCLAETGKPVTLADLFVAFATFREEFMARYTPEEAAEQRRKVVD